jgi:hypothetical protein
MGSPLSFSSTEEFRKKLITRNLKPYRVEGFYTSNISTPDSEVILRDEGVYDSPDDVIGKNLFSKVLYPLNMYGPEGGYRVVNNVTGLNNTKSNLGEYNYQDTVLPETSFKYQEQIPTKNKYSYDEILLEQTEYIQLSPKFETYWSPISFVPSSYSPANILLSDDPQGSDGLLSQDSFIASLGASTLRKLLKDRASIETSKQLFGVNTLDETLGNPFSIQNLISNTNQTNNKSWTITRPENQIDANTLFVQKLEGTYIPLSPIPGDYFDEDMVQKRPTSISQIFGAFNDGTTVSSSIRSILSRTRAPSELFLENTGFGQKSQLFFNLDYNQYKPAYSRGILNDIANAASNVLTDLFNGPEGAPSGFYVGSRRNDPSQIDSPSGDRPVLYQGMESEAIVYGPDRLSKSYENPSGSEQAEVRIGPAGSSLTDGGGIGGGLVWVSPKYKNAGFLATPGGNQGSQDPNFSQVSDKIERDLSTNKNFKNGSILDFTQRLVNSTPSSSRRLSHVGNAINNLSKVFNDGYKEITKGSRVIKYEGSNGQYRGVEYGRLFTKDTPYYTYGDLQKTEGITTSNRKFTYSVMDNTYNLNISPTSGRESTNIKDNKVTKYMFSIENLAWRTSNRPGLTVDELPVCERGPNGGRIMWFPPYDLKFSESSTPSFQDNEFLGRPEPIYTYKSTKRTGSVSFKMIVDYPSILDVIVQRELAKESNRLVVNEIVDSFFAGLLKFDIYELSRRFPTISSNDILNYQNLLNNPNVTNEQITDIGDATKTTNTGGGGDKGVGPSGGNDKSQPGTQNNTPDLQKYVNTSYYFSPAVTDTTVPPTYTPYPDDVLLEETEKTFYTNVVTYNFNTLNTELINKIKELFNQNPESVIKITFEGAQQQNTSEGYSKSLSQSMIDSVQNYFESEELNEFITNTKLQLTLSNTLSSSVQPIGQPQNNGGSSNNYGPYDCSNDFSINKLACRRISITKIESDNIPTNETGSTPQEGNPLPVSPVSRPIEQRVREGISKKLVRGLLSECSYFELIKESNPFVFDTIRDKVKYFNPSFHSMTPEGLNSRLTFLNQCTRPGDTIPTIGPDGKPKYNNAVNTSFGAPPVLVLRIGDFYNTKIIPTGLQIGYEPLHLDINPEGIGVQPMLATITLAFNFVGGSGLKTAIDTLQNALSFNYYANTEIYDERAESTEDTSIRDQETLKQLISQDPNSSSAKNSENKKQNSGGETIGVKTQTTQDAGTLNYQKFMNELLTTSQGYVDTLTNKTDEIIKNYNLGIFTIISEDMSFNKGKTIEFTNPENLTIYGKSNDLQGTYLKYFDRLISGVKSENLEYLKDLKNPNKLGKYKPSTVDRVKDNLITYLNEYKLNSLSNVTTTLNDITQSQVNLITMFSKLDFVLTSSDGYIDSKGGPIIYSGDVTSVFTTIEADYRGLTVKLNDFYEEYKTLTSSGDKLDLTNYPDKIVGDDTDKLFYILMSNIILDDNKRTQFTVRITEGISSEINSNGTPLINNTNFYWNELARGTYKSQKEGDDKTLNDLVNNNQYNPLTIEQYEDTERIINYITIPTPTDIQKTRLTNLYKDGNSNTNDKTFNGKTQFT